MDTNDIKNLKAGQVVYLQNYPVTFKRITMAGVIVNDDVAEESDGNMCYFPAKYLESECFCPEIVTKNTETAPKYDPCRKFRKGDIIKPCQVKGRWHSVSWVGRSGIHFTVTDDEDEDGIVSIKDPDCKLPYITAAVFLELVTPVEEQEPYYTLQDCEEIDGDTVVFWSVRDEHDDTVAKFYVELYRADGAQKAAEAERDRRNAEWRKEQK